MAIEIISPRHRVETRELRLEFDLNNEPHSGYSFPCNEAGRPFNSDFLTKIQELENDPEYSEGHVVVYKHSYTEPAVGICYCGAEVILDYDYCECEHCGQHYNIYGQALRPMSEWEEPWGEDW